MTYEIHLVVMKYKKFIITVQKIKVHVLKVLIKSAVVLYFKQSKVLQKRLRDNMASYWTEMISDYRDHHCLCSSKEPTPSGNGMLFKSMAPVDDRQPSFQRLLIL